MSMIRCYAAICPRCGRDIAQVRKVVAMFEVYCSTEGAGCGHVGPLLSDEALAVAAWNAKADAMQRRREARDRTPAENAALRLQSIRKVRYDQAC